MQHSVKKEVEELAKLQGISVEEVIKEFNEKHVEVKDLYDEIIVWNRGDQSAVLAKVAKVKENIKRQKIEEEKRNGYSWRKNPKYGWVVVGDFKNKKVNDVITVIKSSGVKQEKQIVLIIDENQAVVE